MILPAKVAEVVTTLARENPVIGYVVGLKLSAVCALVQLMEFTSFEMQTAGFTLGS